MGLERVIRKFAPFLLAGSVVINCGKGEECADDNECPGKEICSNGQCLAQAGTCNDDYDCGENQICENYSCVDLTSSLPGVPATTKILDEKAASSILNMSGDKGVLTFSSNSTYAKNLKNGDVIVAGVYDNIPVGLLRKVTSKTETGSEIVVNTTQATLEDAVENGTFEGKISFTPEYVQRAALLVSGVRFGVKEAPLKIDYTNTQVLTVDFDGTELYNCKKSEQDNPQNKCYCEGCKVILDGSFEAGLEGEIKIEIGSFKLKYAKFALTGTESLDLTLSGEFAASIDTNIPEVTVATFPPFPLPVTIAGFPVIVVPSLSVEFGLEAEGELSLESSVSQSLSATYGVEYKNKSWSDIKNFGYDFDFVPPTLTQSGATARAYVKPKLNFDLYAVNGPYAGAEASINGEVYPQQEPWCSLSAGLWIGVGFEAEVLGYNLINYKNTVYEYEKELYTCSGSSPCADECNFNGQKECADETGWKECGDYDNNGCLEWSEKFLCNLDGTSKQYCEEGECLAKTCAENKWQCADGTCIPIAWHCNKKEECPGGLGEDEDGCNQVCTSNAAQCNDGKCISPYAVCDGVYDCNGGEDEAEGCTPICTSSEYICNNWGCIPLIWFCDGGKDCNSGEDEADGCTPFCSSSEYPCNVEECIPLNWLCDGANDCNGGEDEENCPSCTSGEYQCQVECILLNSVCDGIKDCIWGEDEANCTCSTDSDCSLDYLCKKSTGECLSEPSPLCTGASCVPVKIYVYDNGDKADDSFGLEIKDAFYGETPIGGGKEWTVPMVDGQTYEMLLYGIGVPDGIGTYTIELTNAVKVDGPPLEGSDLDDGMSFIWHIKAKK